MQRGFLNEEEESKKSLGDFEKWRLMLLSEATQSNTDSCQIQSLWCCLFLLETTFPKARMSDTVTGKSKQGSHAVLMSCICICFEFTGLCPPSKISLCHTLLLQPSEVSPCNEASSMVYVSIKKERQLSPWSEFYIACGIDILEWTKTLHLLYDCWA